MIATELKEQFLAGQMPVVEELSVVEQFARRVGLSADSVVYGRQQISLSAGNGEITKQVVDPVFGTARLELIPVDTALPAFNIPGVQPGSIRCVRPTAESIKREADVWSKMEAAIAAKRKRKKGCALLAGVGIPIVTVAALGTLGISSDKKVISPVKAAEILPKERIVAAVTPDVTSHFLAREQDLPEMPELTFQDRVQVRAGRQITTETLLRVDDSGTFSGEPVSASAPPLGSEERLQAYPSTQELAIWDDSDLEQLDWNVPDLEKWAERLASEFELEKILIGGTAQGREIFALSTDPIEGEGREIILLVAGVHANERTARLASNNTFEGLLRVRESGQIEIPENTIIVHVPIANPDGLENDLLDPGSGRKDGDLVPFPYERPGAGPTDCVIPGTYNGRDPNRGFPALHPDAPLDYAVHAAKRNPCNPQYPGETPGKVTEALMHLVQDLERHGSVSVIDYHGWKEEVVGQRSPVGEARQMAEIYAAESGYLVSSVTKYSPLGKTFTDYLQGENISGIAVETGGGGDNFVPGGDSRDNRETAYFTRDQEVVRSEVEKHLQATLEVIDFLISSP